MCPWHDRVKSGGLITPVLESAVGRDDVSGARVDVMDDAGMGPLSWADDPELRTLMKEAR